MASMNFEHSTIANLMSLVDDHKDDFKEGEYLQMCNAMKFLHNQTLRPCGTPQYTPTPTPERFTNAHAASVIIDSIRKMERDFASNGRVTNADKLKVLNELFIAHSISTQNINVRTDTERVGMMTRRVRQIVPARTLNAMYKEAKEQRIEVTRPRLRAHIIEQEAKLARLNTFPPQDAYRPENIRL